MADLQGKVELETWVAKLTRSSLGLDIFPRTGWLEWLPQSLPAEISSDVAKTGYISSLRGYISALLMNHYVSGFWMAAKYILFFWTIPWLLHMFMGLPWSGTGTLYALQVYGGLWAGWATATTGLTACALQRTINTEIIPLMSDKAALAIAQELGRRFERKRFLGVSWMLGLLSAGLAGGLVSQDIGSSADAGEIMFWSAGWAILFTTSAGVVNVAQYYATFSNHLKNDASTLFGLDPSRSPMLVGIASLGKQTLTFWLGIAISIALLVPFAHLDWTGFPERATFVGNFTFGANRFVLVDLVITSFFSIGVGTIVFLSSEAALRRAVRISSNAMLQHIEVEVTKLIPQLTNLNDADWKRLSDLRGLHEKVAASGSYKGALVSGLSIILPFITPVVSLTLKFLHSGASGHR